MSTLCSFVIEALADLFSKGCRMCNLMVFADLCTAVYAAESAPPTAAIVQLPPTRVVLTRAYPLLIDAVGRCPLEDCGRPDRYMEMLEALRDPAHPRYAEVIKWPGPDFDPTDASRGRLEQDVADLAKLMTPRRRSSAKSSAKPRKAKGDDWF
jgi:hypothetical protein